MGPSRDLHRWTDPRRRASEFLARLEKAGPPIVLTIDGEAELVVQDTASFRMLTRLADRVERIRSIQEAIASMERGEGTPADEVFDALEAELETRDGA